jgi:hypothetical protein
MKNFSEDIRWMFEHKIVVDNNIDRILQNISLGYPFSFISVSTYNKKGNLTKNIHLACDIKERKGYGFLLLQENWEVCNIKSNKSENTNRDSLFIIASASYKDFIARMRKLQIRHDSPNIIMGRYVKKSKTYNIKIYDKSDIIFESENHIINNIDDINILINKRDINIGNDKFRIDKISLNAIYRYFPKPLHINGHTYYPRETSILGFNDSPSQ